ncbi:MAG TPA: hypothetical protein VM491_17895 [Burkholderiaceae bacterium]|nr:hypothetical protein [Burkholderiaceae bacterium]
MRFLNRRWTTAAIGVPLLAACATNPDGTMRLDDRATGALLGAAAGCGMAQLLGRSKDCARGAVAGAIAGFLVGWHFESKRIASAEQVNREYAAKQKLPRDSVQPVAFETKVTQTGVTPQGERQVEVTSNTDLVGYGDRTPKLQQRYAIYDENDQLLDQRTENIAADGAGRYETRSSFKLPPDAKEKKYRVESTLISDGKEVKSGRYTISWVGGAVMVAGG